MFYILLDKFCIIPHCNQSILYIVKVTLGKFAFLYFCNELNVVWDFEC